MTAYATPDLSLKLRNLSIAFRVSTSRQCCMRSYLAVSTQSQVWILTSRDCNRACLRSRQTNQFLTVERSRTLRSLHFALRNVKFCPHLTVTNVFYRVLNSVYMRAQCKQRLTRFLASFRLTATQSSPLTVIHKK